MAAQVSVVVTIVVAGGLFLNKDVTIEQVPLVKAEEPVPLPPMEARSITLKDVPQMSFWLYRGRPENGFDPDILDYPTLRAWAATNGSPKPVAYLPGHTVLMLESLALDPDADARHKMAAVLAAFEQACAEAKASGIREVIYLHSDDRLDETAERMGFKRVTAYRRKL